MHSSFLHSLLFQSSEADLYKATVVHLSCQFQMHSHAFLQHMLFWCITMSSTTSLVHSETEAKYQPAEQEINMHECG
jgi:hypothetical protein